MTIWVTGAAGMLGQDLVALLRVAGHTILASDREVDITDIGAVDEFLHQAAGTGDGATIDWIVNCAAWTAVDAAEEHEENAMRLNAVGPEILAETAQRLGAAILHISTDYVFNGTSTKPYHPDDHTAPASAYGRTKLAGERAVRDACKRHVIIRTAWLYGVGGKNFVYTMLRLMNERAEIGVVADQRGLPTYVPDLAAAIGAIVAKAPPLEAWGTYHYTNAPGNTGQAEHGISWFDFASAIQKEGRAAGLLNDNCQIKPLTTAEYPTPATRPAYSVLDCDSIVETFGVQRPAWDEALRQFLQSAHRNGAHA